MVQSCRVGSEAKRSTTTIDEGGGVEIIIGQEWFIAEI